MALVVLAAVVIGVIAILCGFALIAFAVWRGHVTMLGGLAEFERELILARTGDGRKRAMAKAVKFGRPQPQRQEAIQRLANGEAQTDVARGYAVSQATISRLVNPGPFGEAVVA
jgi:hypothetical protein